MGKIGKWIAYSLGGLVMVAGVTWTAIGADWRAFLSNPPSGPDVLFWTQDQRNAGFRMMDKVPFIIESRDIAPGAEALALPNGPPLNVDMDLDAYFADNNIVSAVVLHKGEVRYENYAMRFTADGRWTSFSVAKSLTSTLVGAAIKDGYIDSLDAKVTDYIEGLKGSPYDDVTIAQLLTMTSGVDWNEDYGDPNSDVARFLTHVPTDGQPITVSYMQNLTRAHPPGEVWNYSTGETNLIGILVSEATGKRLADYLSEKIWAPYGMQARATWLVGADDKEVSGCCIQATTRDFARFGQFILEGARIDGTPIVPDDWLGVATTKQADIGDPGFGYGYQWWTMDDGTFDAKGIFGQGILIDPGRDLVIASNSSWPGAVPAAQANARAAFYAAIQAAIDAETPTPPTPTEETTE